MGLPSLVGRAKKKSFGIIKERIWNKLKGWKEKLLSQAGREILVKAVMQAIPTYTMSCFELPKGSSMILSHSLGSFGGDIVVNKGKYIGLVGRKCVGLRVKEGWGSEN